MSQTAGSISDSELLARYILRKEWIRADGTLKPDGFIPYQHTSLSVTRHIRLNEAEIWQLGENVAALRQRKLLGRGDAQATVYRREKLGVIPDPLIDNSNHANIVGWPTEKQLQKSIALEVVRSVKYLPKPSE